MEDRARGVSRKEPAQISCSEKKEQEAFGCPYKTAAASNNRMNTKKGVKRPGLSTLLRHIQGEGHE